MILKKNREVPQMKNETGNIKNLNTFTEVEQLSKRNKDKVKAKSSTI